MTAQTEATGAPPRTDVLPALDGLGQRIKAAHRRCEAATEDALAAAREAGVLLVEAKRLVPHGGWLPWLADHAGMTPRSAQLCMRIARRWDEIPNTQRDAHLPLRAAARMLSSPKPTESDLGVDPVVGWFSDLLDAGHLEAAARLEGLYPPGLMRRLDLGGLNPDDVDSPQSAFFDVLNPIRPLENPVVLPMNPPGEVVELTRWFVGWVRDSGGRVPQWRAAAMWWLACAARYGWSVPTLAKRIDRWSLAYADARAWWWVVGVGRGMAESEDESIQRVAHGCQADLRHSGSLDAAPTYEEFQAMDDRLDGSESYIVPSEMQDRCWLTTEVGR